MDRRDTIKSLFLGSVAAGFALSGCAADIDATEDLSKGIKLSTGGKTETEIIRDNALLASNFFTEHELLTVATLCDIILPSNQQFGSANDAGTSDFIDFMVKDMPAYQIPIRGGIMWLDAFSNKLYNTAFIKCSNSQQLVICDQIAYPKKTKPELKPGEQFFTRMRKLTLTGYFTSQMGIEDLGYIGNTPNVWDGIPEEVLKDHDVAYEKDWLAKCVDQSKRGDIAVWDDEGNLLS